MNRRLIAAAALGAAVVLGTTGCSMISPQATTIQYNAAEGVNIPDTGDLDVRNAFIVATEDGSEGNLIAAIVNSTDERQTLTVEIGEGSDTVEITIQVPAKSTVSLGGDDEPELIEGLELVPGTDVPAYFASGDSGSLVSLPILDGELEYLAPLVP